MSADFVPGLILLSACGPAFGDTPASSGIVNDGD